VYVKPYFNEDMASYVKKVHFKLHESYANANRILTKPPYEVTETGWGEFEIVIKIYFHDPTERPVTIYHILKLFQSPLHEGEVSSSDSKKGLVSESYEEIVFQEPTQLMQQLLTNVQPMTNGVWKHDTDCEWEGHTFADDSLSNLCSVSLVVEEKKIKCLENILDTRTKVSAEIASLKDKLTLARETIKQFKNEIAKVQEPAIE
jgi:YEATS domain-containing protein 4